MNMSRGEIEFAGTQQSILAGRLISGLASLWKRALRLARRSPKRLRLCESLPLGDRRFVAVLEFEGTRFLLGGTANSLVLLSRLAVPRPSGESGDAFSSNDEAEPVDARQETKC